MTKMQKKALALYKRYNRRYPTIYIQDHERGCWAMLDGFTHGYGWGTTKKAAKSRLRENVLDWLMFALDEGLEIPQ